jgi:hypothetical protein
MAKSPFLVAKGKIYGVFKTTLETEKTDFFYFESMAQGFAAASFGTIRPIFFQRRFLRNSVRRAEPKRHRTGLRPQDRFYFGRIQGVDSARRQIDQHSDNPADQCVPDGYRV